MPVALPNLLMNWQLNPQVLPFLQTELIIITIFYIHTQTQS